MLNLENRSFCIFGLPNSGKSTLAHYILNQYEAHAFVYDTLNEFPPEPFDSYAPKGRYDAAELEAVIRPVMTGGKYSLIIIDEANRFCPSKPKSLPQAIADLNDWRAHYNLSVGFLTRRPTQLNQDLTELSDLIISFGLDGVNDIHYLNELKDGFGDIVSNLAKYHFAIYSKEDREVTVYSPVPAELKTDKIISA